MNLNGKVSATQRKAWIIGALAAVALSCIASIPASAQTWTGGGGPDWFMGNSWTGGVSPNSPGAVVSILSPVNNPVQLNAAATVATLTLGPANELDINAGATLVVAGGSIVNAGTILLNAPGTNNAYLQLTNDMTLSGTGNMVLNGGQIGTDTYGRLLTNQSTISGYGTIGSSAGPNYQYLSLNNSGTVDANIAGNTLFLQGTGASMTNSGLMEATSGGTLNIQPSAAINNSGGNITASGAGSIVNVNATIQGGTFNTSGGGVIQTNGTAQLDGSTQGAVTISNGSTYTAGGTSGTYINGSLSLAGASSNLALSGYLVLNGDTTISGPGTVTMTGGNIGTDTYGRTLTNNSIIQGSGVIGSNASYDYQYLSLNNSGTINANSTGNILSIQGTGNSIVNNNVFEATNGGILNLATAAAVQNANGQIIASGAGSTVNVSTTIEGGTLTTNNGGVMQTSGTATLDASDQGAITLSNGTTYTAGAGSNTSILGTLNLNSGSTLALGGQLRLTGDTTFAGPGIVIMSSTDGETGQIGTDSYGRTLNNQTTIEGSGLIGSNASYVYPSLSLNNSGTINANVSGQSLTIGGSGSFVTNTGLFEATNGGILDLTSNAAVLNQGANITADGGTVNISNTIQGGTLNTLNGGVMQTAGFATLDASSHGANTLSDGSTYTAGAGSYTSITGTLNLGTTTGSTFDLGGQLRLTGDTTFTGPGVVVMSSTDGQTGQIGTDSYGRVLYNQSTIEGSGLIGSNASDVYPSLSLNNSGTINANVGGQSLTIGGSGNYVTNTGLFEATNGGILDLTSSAPVLNQGANITANGGTVNVSTTIQGGTLNTLNGGIMQTAGSATLDGASHGAITLSDGSTYGAGAGTLTYIAGALNLGTTTGSTFNLGGQLRLTGDLTLSGPGTLVMSSTDGETGQIGTDSYGRTLTNMSTIQGSGLIGSNASSVYPALSINNMGTINANVNGQTLGIGSTSGSITNTGLFEATNGATLNLFTAPPINNTGGTILASGAGSTVLVNTTIQGGSLTTTGGAMMQTGNSGATLDGATNGAITITDGSTYSAGNNALTRAFGTVNLGTSTGGTLAVGAGAQLQIGNGDLTLTGPGSLTMTSSGMNIAQIGTDGYGRNLTNESTIQGAGLIGSNVGALYQNLNVGNSANGLILANQAGGTLQIGGTGNTTNSGTLQANAGSTLEVSNNLINFSGSTLAGGTYYANGGTLQLNVGNNSNGGEIVTDAANITVSGAGAVNDLGNHNALSDLAMVAANSSLALINGAQLSTAAATFTNSGTVTVGAGGSQLNVASGAFVQGSSGTFVEEIGGTGAGDFGLTNISGTDTLDGTLDVDLIDGFKLAANTDYALTFMDSGDAIGAFSNIICPTNDTCSITYNGPGNGDVTLDINGPVQGGTPPVPEPATFGMLLSGLASLAAGMKMRRSRNLA